MSDQKKQKYQPLKFPQSLPFDQEVKGEVTEHEYSTADKSRLELMQEMHQRGLIGDKTLRDAAFGPGVEKMMEAKKMAVGSLADQALRAQAKALQKEVDRHAIATMGTVASDDPVDQELDMAPGSVARRIVDVACRQAKLELTREDTLLGEMCELLTQRLNDQEKAASLMLEQLDTLQRENQQLRAQNLKLTDLVLDKLGVGDESVRANEASEADEDEAEEADNAEDGSHRGPEEEESGARG